MLGFYLALIDEYTDKELFKEIYRNNKKKMYKTAFSILNNHSLAEEALQESLLSIAKNISRFRGLDNKHAAVLTVIIARNKAISLKRSENSERGGKETINYSDETEVEISDKITIKENYAAVLTAIKSLNSIYSDTLILKYVYGYSSKTIADMLNVSVRTIDSRLYTGKKLLAEKLEEQYAE